MTARLFLLRWSGRILRQEWRQHALIFLLIAFATGIGIAGVLSAYNLVEPPENRYGTGDVIANVPGDKSPFADAMVEQGHTFGVVETGNISIPGAAQRVKAKVIDPQNEVTKPLIDLRSGRWPESPNELAVTDQVPVDTTEIGQTIDIANETFEIVGVVEDPTNLKEEFVLVTDLDTVGLAEKDQLSLFLVDAKPEDVTFPVGVANINLESRSDLVSARTAVALAVQVVSAIALLEMALLVGASFAVIARRRSRQYGLLASAGATARHIRGAAGMTGGLLGVAGAVVGLLGGVAVAAVVAPLMETTVGHRISLAVPWWAIVPNVVFAVIIATLAARWPTRPLSRLPVVYLLSSLRPRPAPVGRSTIVGVVLAVLGTAALVAGFRSVNPLLAIVGTLVAPIGLLLLAPLLVRFVGVWSSSLPVAARMAGRTISRHNRRSAAVVAALAIALGIPTGLAVTSKSIDTFNETKAPNLDTNMAIAWIPGVNDAPPHIPADSADRETSSIGEDLQAVDADWAVVPIDVAVPVEAQVERADFPSVGPQSALIPLFSATPLVVGSNCFDCEVFSFTYDDASDEVEFKADDAAWVGTPELLGALDIDPTAFDGSVDAIAVSNDHLAVSQDGPSETMSDVVYEPTLPINTSIASMLISPDQLDPNEVDVVTVGWLAIADSPISTDDRSAIANVTESTMLAEFHQPPSPQSGLRSASLALGILIGLGIAVSAVSLLTTESAEDLRVLQSLGASPAVARQLSSSVAAILAGAGAFIAVGVGYLALIPLLTLQGTDLPFVVPWLTLLGLLVLFPALAAGASWFVTATKTTGLARPL